MTSEQPFTEISSFIPDEGEKEQLSSPLGNGEHLPFDLDVAEEKPPQLQVKDWLDEGIVAFPDQYEEIHPFSEEARSEEEREPKRQKARRIFQTFRQHPSFRWVAGALMGAVGLGIVEASQGKQSDLDNHQTLTAEQALQEIEAYQQLMADKSLQYELKELIFAELVEQGTVLTEQEARTGRPEWNVYESDQYADKLGDLNAMFEYLHKFDGDLLRAKSTPENRVKNYDALARIMGKEFEHSTLMWDFSRQVIEEAPRVFVEMEEKEAIEAYQKLFAELTKNVGLEFALEMTDELSHNFHAESALRQFAKKEGMYDEQIRSWHRKDRKNTVYFHQDTGQLNVMRLIDPKEVPFLKDVGEDRVLIKLWSAPANGGRPDGVDFRAKNVSGKVHKRTPDGVFPYLDTIKKTSPDWQMSWIQDVAPLRWSENKTSIEYQDVDGKWYQATGEEAVFASGTEHPFRDLTDSLYYKRASSKTTDENGQVVLKRPRVFVVDDFLTEEGELRQTWSRNDFGPLSIQMMDLEHPKGPRTASIYIHSNPVEDQEGWFLDYSHACIHAKSADIQYLDGYLGAGSEVRISSITLQNENS
ncbi:TPA: hypothetical protein DDZ01_00675 [Candidatus Uhrbacteria bacterium]|nr:hypothetical protein [Candidatus Uhrbacteria bacterium]HCB56071.1 hypothetical protein [Candidatus Uhrbacteria bacterium]